MEAARLFVTVGANVTDLDKGLDHADKRFTETAKTAEHAGSRMGSFFSSAASAATGFIAADVFGKVSSGIAGFLTDGIKFNSEMEQVSARLSAFTKDGTQTAKILEDIKQEAATTPFAFQEMAKATASLLPVAKTSGAALMDLVKQAEILAASNPAQGLEGAAFALREAMSGDFTSIIERFDLPRQRLNELKAQGVPALQAIQTAMKEMGLDTDLVSKLGETAAGRWSTFQDTITGIKAKLSEKIFEGLSSQLQVVQNWFDTNKEAIDAWATKVGEGIGKAFGWLIAQAPTVIGAVQSVINALSGIDDIISGILGLNPADYGSAWEAFAAQFQLIKERVTPYVEQFLSIVQTVVGFIKDNFPTIATIVGTAIGAFAVFQTVIGPITAVAATISSLVAGFSAFSATVAAGTPVLTAIIAILGGPLTVAIAATVAIVAGLFLAWQTNFLGIRDIVADVVAWITPKIESVIATLFAFGAEVLPELQATFESIKGFIQNLADFIQPVIEGIVGFIRDNMGTIQSIFEGTWKIIEGVIDIAWAIISNSFKFWLNIIQGDWSGAWQNVKDMFSGVWEGIKKILEGAWQVMKGEVELGVKAVVALVGELPGKAVDAVKSIGTSLYQSGKDLIQGFINGIGAMGQSLWNSVTTLIKDNVPEPVRKALGISSPSKLFYEYGQQTVQGYINGVQGMQPQLKTAMEQMSNAVASTKLPQLSAGTPTGQAPFGTIAGGGPWQTVLMQANRFGMGQRALDLKNAGWMNPYQAADALAQEWQNQQRASIGYGAKMLGGGSTGNTVTVQPGAIQIVISGNNPTEIRQVVGEVLDEHLGFGAYAAGV